MCAGVSSDFSLRLLHLFLRCCAYSAWPEAIKAYCLEGGIARVDCRRDSGINLRDPLQGPEDAVRQDRANSLMVGDFLRVRGEGWTLEGAMRNVFSGLITPVDARIDGGASWAMSVERLTLARPCPIGDSRRNVHGKQSTV